MSASCSAAVLLLADSRLPSGAHAHSAGLAAAVAQATVDGERTLAAFLDGRLATAGVLAAAVAARSCALVTAGAPAAGFIRLARQVDARLASPAARDASRAQGRGLARAAARSWPNPAWALLEDRPHGPVALGVAIAAAGSSPAAAAGVAALGALTLPASAAVRLLGLDPLAVTALLAARVGQVDAVAAAGAAYADLARALPAPAAPLSDLLAEAYRRAEVRLFAS